VNLIFQKKDLSPQDIQSQLIKIAGVFLVISAIILTFSPIVRERSFDTPLRWDHWIGVIVWLLAFYIIHRQTCQKIFQIDPYLIPLAGLLSGWGLLSIWRVISQFGLRQTIWLAFAAVLYVAGLKLSSDLGLLRRYKYLWLFGGLGVTTMTIIFGTNPMGIGPRLWLGCCGVYFQPSEPLKLLLVIYLAAYLADRQPLTSGLIPLLAPTIIMTGFTLLILLVQRDLGTASIFIFIYTGIIYAATGKKRILLLSFIILISASIGSYILFDVVRARVDAWINPWIDPSGRSYQIVQSLIAQAAGGIGGRGPGMGSPDLVPIAHSDFIFSTISEEYGLVGTFALFLTLILLTLRGFRIGIQATNRYHRYLSVGLSVFIASQSLLIIGGNIRLLPLTGITLPFVSYGGSSLVTSFIALLLLTHINNYSSDNQPLPANSTPIMVLAGILIAGFVSATVVNSWWGFVRGPDLLTRTDNARRTISDRHVKRGVIIDRNGEYLSESIGIPGEFKRVYYYPILSPLIGYTHPYYGQAGAEASLDPILRGLENQNPWILWFNHILYGEPPPGLDVRISIDIQKQIMVDKMIGEIPGAIILMDAGNGQILLMTSTPTYDANRLDEIWEELIKDEQSPLVNRVTQGSYPPGNILDPFIFAANETYNNLDELFNFFINLGFYSAPNIRLPTTTQPLPETFNLADMRLNPLQLASGLTALNNQGELVKPEYILEIKNPDGVWEKYSPEVKKESVFSGIIAHQIIESMTNDDLPLWHLTSIATTDTGTQITWFIGGTTAEAENNYIVVVVLEEKNELLANMIGESLLTED
jgi:cell division protein FtsW (lipid II flippase)